MQKLNDLLWNLWEDPLYITFIARKEEFQNRAFRRKGKSYLRVVVPYDEVLKNEDNLPLLLHYLAKNVDRLKWLNHSSLKKTDRRPFRKRPFFVWQSRAKGRNGLTSK